MVNVEVNLVDTVMNHAVVKNLKLNLQKNER